MSHGPEHQIEHAEHAIHASHDVFNKNVTMSIAMVAAVLACVTMLGHRAHNETLRLQGEALSLQTEASIKSTKTANLASIKSTRSANEASIKSTEIAGDAGIKSTETANKWALYQSKNLFSLESEIARDMLKASPAGPHRESKEFVALVKGFEENVEYYMGDKDYQTRKSKNKPTSVVDEIKKGAGKLAKMEDEARNLEKETAKILNAGKTTVKEILNKGETEVEDILKKGEAEADEILKKAEARIKDSHFEHMRAARLDYGELALQFAVVLCSLAILTKSRSFWFFGIGSGALGAVVAVTGQFGLFMGHHH